MIIYNVLVIAHNETEKILIANTAKGIYELEQLTNEQLLNCAYEETYTRIKVLKELDILTYNEYYYLTDYIFTIWKYLKNSFINETII